MATRKGGLGKGLDSLIADKVGTSNEKTDAKNEVTVFQLIYTTASQREQKATDFLQKK